MPFLAPNNPNAPKKVTWLELFFDLIFALALAISAKPLEHVSDFSTSSLIGLGEFILIFVFLIMFWYRHMVLVNRFDHSSFLFALITLLIGFLVVAFTQFLRMWRIEPELGSFLATITLFLLVISIATLYFISSVKGLAGTESAGEKTWTRATSKHMLWEALCYLPALLVTPGIRPFWFIVVFIYFNRYPFETYFNPKKQTTLNPALINLPAENVAHKSERIGLFALLVYGLVIVLAATPLLTINHGASVEEVLGPVIVFGKVFFFISIIWYLHYRLIEIVQPKTNQFTVMTFFSLGLLVAATHFIRIMLEHPSNFVSAIFAVCSSLLLTISATEYWNVKTIAGIPPTAVLFNAFRQWSYLLYAAAAAFFASIFFQSPIREAIWKITIIIAFIVLMFDKRLTLSYSKSMAARKFQKIFDNQTVTGITFVVLGLIIFFILTALLGKAIASWWIIIWLTPLIIGFFMIINHWLHARIRPN